MKKQLIENRIKTSLNSFMPSQNVIAEAKDYMQNNAPHKISKNKVFKYSAIAVSCICIILVFSILLPILLTGGYTEDKRLIETKDIYEENCTSIKDYDDNSLLSFDMTGKNCKQFLLKETNEILFIKEEYVVSDEINASEIEQIVVMKNFTDIIIQNLEEYMYMENSFAVNENKIKYKEISNGSFCFSFNFEEYGYYIIINGTDFETSKILIKELLNY